MRVNAKGNKSYLTVGSARHGSARLGTDRLCYVQFFISHGLDSRRQLKFSIQAATVPKTPAALSLSKSRLWGTTSKTFWEPKVLLPGSAQIPRITATVKPRVDGVALKQWDSSFFEECYTKTIKHRSPEETPAETSALWEHRSPQPLVPVSS